MDNEYNETLLGWNFKEFDGAPKSSAWYLWYGIIAALLVIVAVFTDNFLFAIIIVLFSLIVFLHDWKGPDQIEFKFTPEALHLGDKKYPLKDINEFWIAYQPPNVEKVFFDFNSSLRPVLGIPLEGNNPLHVREVLLEYLSENLENEDEPLSDGLARMLKL